MWKDQATPLTADAFWGRTLIFRVKIVTLALKKRLFPWNASAIKDAAWSWLTIADLKAINLTCYAMICLYAPCVCEYKSYFGNTLDQCALPLLLFYIAAAWYHKESFPNGCYEFLYMVFALPYGILKPGSSALRIILISQGILPTPTRRTMYNQDKKFWLIQFMFGLMGMLRLY